MRKFITDMYRRIFDIENRLDEAMFLFGGRQTGKSTLLKERFPKAVYIDLLKSDVRNRFKQHPEEFRESLLRYPPETLVIVDEIQKVPELLDEVHWLMVEKGCGSSSADQVHAKSRRAVRTTLAAELYRRLCSLW